MAAEAERQVYICMRCGRCCRWAGYVFVTADEVERMAAFLGLEVDAFVAAHTELMHDRSGLTLTTKGGSDDCIFFEPPNRCRVYEVRPRQCIMFPDAWQVDDLDASCSAVRLRYRCVPKADET